MTSIQNIRKHRTNTLDISTSSVCPQITKFANLEETRLIQQDTNYEYNLGLWDITINCSTPGATAHVKIYLDALYQTDTWVYRKYNNQTKIYSDMSNEVTYSTASNGENMVTVIEYDITDGGHLDEDGEANGIIIDPSGPSILKHPKGR